MPTPLENFRAQYPAYNDLSDAEVADNLYKRYYSDIPRKEFNERLGFSGISASPDGVTFSEAVQAGTESLGNSMVALEAGVYDLFGDTEAADAAIQEYYKNQQHISTLLEGATDWRDIANADSFGDGAQRTLDYVMENFGMNSPQMAAILAGGLGTAAIAPYTPEPISLAISKLGGFTVGATAVALPMFTGFNVGRQIDEGQDPDILKGAFWSIPQSIVEAKLANVYTTTGLTKVGESVLGKFSNSTATNVAKKMSELIAVGVPSEVIQQAMERTAANLEWNPLQSEEAFNEYVDTAFQAAAAMSPMGSLALIHGDKTTIKDRSEEEKKKILSEETQKIVKRELENSPEPKKGMFKTAKEAESALKSVGINPNMFDSKAAKVRAANIVVQKIDTNRAKFLEAYNLANPMPQPSFKPASILAEQKTAKVPLGPVQIESLRTDQDFREFGSLLSSTTIPVYPDVPSLDISEAPETYSAAVKANQDLRARMLTSAAGTNKKTISDIPGAIQADFNEMLKGFEKDLKLPATELRKIAVDKFKIPEKDLKDNVGKWLPKQEVANRISEKIAENGEKYRVKPKEGQVVNPVPQQPLNKITDNDLKTLEDLFSGAEKSVQIVSEKIKPVIDAMTRISDETGVPLKMKNHLGIDSVTRTFKSAMKAAQAMNKIFTAVNFSDTKAYPNIELNLQEAWAYTFSNLPKTTREAIMAEIPDILNKIPDEAVKKNLELWAKVNQGKEEIVSNLFSDYASAVRKKEKFTQPIPKETKAQFDKLIKFLEKSKDSAKGQGFITFSDLFPSVADSKTPRDSLFDSVEAMRKERLKSFSDALQFQNWKDISEVDFRKFMDDSIKKGVKISAMEKTSWYTKKVASAVHLASRNPIFAVAQVMRGQQEKLQSKFLTTFSDAGEVWGREPSKEVKIKAAQVLDHLRNTDQKLVKDKDGAIVFERDGQLIRLKHPDMVEVIESLDNLGKTILNAHEGELRAGLNRVLKDSLIKPLKEIKQDFAKAEPDLSEDDIAFVKNQINVLENIEHLKQFPYVPRSRFGSFGFTVHLKSNLNKNGKVLPNKDPEYHAQVEEGNHKGRWNELQYNEVQEALKEYRGKPEYVIFEDSKDSPYEMTYQNMYDRVSQDSFTLEMIAGLVGADKTEQYFVDVKKKLDQKTRYRGFNRRLAQAKNIKGYSQDWERVISSYTTAAAHFLAQSRYAPLLKEYGEKVDTLSRNQQWVKDKVASYIEYTASPHDSFQNIRSINFSWTMGFNVSSAALQVMTLPTSSLSSMTQYNLNPIKNARLLSKYFGVGVSTILDKSSLLYENGSVVFKIDDPDTVAALKKSGMDDDMIRFMKKAFHENFTSAGTVEELTGKKNYETRSKKGSVKEKAGFITNFLAIPMSLMEQITRFSTVAAHYDMFRNNPDAVKRGLKVLENDHRFQALRKVSGNSLVEDLAFYGLDEAHAVFGKTGRSDLLRGGLGAFAFPFATYPMQIVEFMKRMYGRGPEGKMALALMMGSLMFFAGGLGLPGAELLKELAEEAWKQYEGEEIDIEYLIRQKLTDATGDPRYGQFATQGFFRAFANLDVSKRIQTPLFGQEWILAMMGVRGDITQIAGVQGSMATNALEAWQAYNRDESGAKIASMLSPTALANLFKAYSYYDEGVSTMNDTQLLTPEQIKENPEQIFFRLLGFSSDMVASAREAQYWAQLEDKRYKPAMDKFRAKAKNYLTKQIRALNSGNKELADEYKEKFAGVMDDIVEFANRKGFLVNVPSLNRSIIDAVTQRIEGGLQFEQLSKANRHKKDSIERAAGVK